MTSPDTLNPENSPSPPAQADCVEVLISGVTFGPFSETKIRERLAEGLVAITDQARIIPSEEWKSLQEVLEQLASSPQPECSEPISRETYEAIAANEAEKSAEAKADGDGTAAPAVAKTVGILPPQGPSSRATAFDGPLRSRIRTSTGPLTGTPPQSGSPAKTEAAAASIQPPTPATKPAGGIRSQILARTSQEPLKVGAHTGTAALADRATTTPLSFSPLHAPTSVPQPAPESPSPGLTPVDNPPAPRFPTSRPKLEDEPEEPVEPPAENAESSGATEDLSTTSSKSLPVSPATRSISVAAFATGSLPRPAAVSSAARPTDSEPPDAASDAILTVRLPARRTQVIKATPGAAVKGTDTLKTADSAPTDTAQNPMISFRPTTPSGNEGKSFTSPLPPPTRPQNTSPDAPATPASVPSAPDTRDTVNPMRRGMANAAALAATTPLPTYAKIDTETPYLDDFKDDSPSATPLVDTRRAALREARLRRKRKNMFFFAVAVVLFALLCVGIFHYTAEPQKLTPPPPAKTTPPSPVKTSSVDPVGNAKVTSAPAMTSPPGAPPPPAADPKVLAHVNQGQADLAKSDLNGAIGEFTQALLLDPKYAPAYGYRAAARHATGDYEGAIADDDQLLTLEPHNANGFSQRGFIKQANKDLDGAIADYSRAIDLDPKSIIAFYNRGMIQEQKNQPDAAIADYNRALEINPKLPGAFYNRGNAKMDKADLDGAIADYTSALQINPKIALASCNRALAEQNLGNLDAAMADYNQALALDPKIAMAYYNRGLIKEQRNDLNGCIDDSTKTLELDPSNAQAYYNRGVALQAKGNLDAAANDLRKFGELAPKNIYADYAHLYLWVITNEQNHKPQADQELTNCLESNWNAEPAQLPSKIASFLLDHLSENDLMVLASSPDAKKDRGQHCEVWYFNGIKKMLTGNKVGAIDCFHQCLNTGQKDFCEYILAQAQLQTISPS